MVVRKDVLEKQDVTGTDLGQINYGRRQSEGEETKPAALVGKAQRPSREELIKALDYWQSRNLLKEKERFPERKIRTNRKCYTEYFVAKSLDQQTGEQRTVAELVAENVSKRIVLLAFIATKPEVRCSGIGSELMRFFRQVVEQENDAATIFLEVDDPEVGQISEEERQIRRRRINWYLRQGAVMWNGYYEMPNVLDKRRHGNKAIFMALPRSSETISFEQLKEAALQVLKTAYGISAGHWLYKKVQGELSPPAAFSHNVSPARERNGDNGASEVSGHLRQERINQTLSFLKAQLRDSTKYGALTPEEAIKRYLELERARKLKLLEEDTNDWNVESIASYNRDEMLERVNHAMR